MKKNLFEISSGEVQRILSLHESRTKSQYLNVINEIDGDYQFDSSIKTQNTSKPVNNSPTKSVTLGTEATIEMAKDDWKNNPNGLELRLPKGTKFTVKDAGNLISQNIDYKLVSDYTGSLVDKFQGQIRFNCSSKRFKPTNSAMSFADVNFEGLSVSLTQLFNGACAYASSAESQAETDKAKTKSTTLEQLKQYPCLSTANGLTLVLAPNGAYYYKNAQFRYWSNGTKQPSSTPLTSDKNVQNIGFVPFDCNTEFKTPVVDATKTDSTLGGKTDTTKTQQVKTQQVNRQKQFTQNTLAAINNVQKALGVPQPNGQLKNSDIDNIISKLQ